MVRAGLVVVLGAAASTFWLLFSTHDRGLTSAVIQAVSAVLVPAAGVGTWLLRRRSDAPAVDLDAAAETVAAAARLRWERGAAERRLLHPSRIPVRWSWSEKGVGGLLTDAVRSPASRLVSVPGLAPVGPWQLDDGGLPDLLGVFGGIGSGRLILLGAAGAGKSSAAIMLALDVLGHRADLADPAQRRSVPVPVLLTLAGWDPSRQRLNAWAARRLELEYPFLAATEYGRGTARQLVETGRLALLLDGLDDLPERLRPVALRALDEQADARLVLLCRSRELADAVAVGGHLAGAATLELRPVTPGQAAAYLERCRVDPPPPGWRRLVDHLRRHPDDPVTQALDTPLMLSLVRDTFPPGDDISRLLPDGGFPSREAVEDYLLQRVLTTAYAHRPGQAAPPYTAAQARHWLGHIAARMGEQHTRDLAWWLIRRWQPAWFRVAATALTVFLTLGVGLSFLVSGALNAKVVFYAAVSAVFLGLVYGPGGGLPRQWATFRWPEVVAPATLRKTMLFFAAVGMIFGLMLSLVFGYVYGLVSGLLSGAGAGLVSWFFHALARPSVDLRSPLPPPACWQRERRYRMVFGLTLGLAFGLAIGLANILASPDHGTPVEAITAAMEGGIPYGLVFGVVSSKTWAAGLTFCQLRLAGVGPLRMMSFLDDACDRDVLRVAGPSYQFRHARLQDCLAASWSPE
ncbi:hypothetical protein ACIA5G_39355 [Amycolatopsis sp. NPDC051758]|uniref:hypothetical protein n=1 Tax=Amycolatopsis sp. NPDC051758 TaxID=3363935 RepID=UPI00378AE62E